MRKSIRFRLSVVFLLLATVPTVLVGLGLAWRNYAVQEQQALRLQAEMTRRVAAELRGFFELLEGEIRIAASQRFTDGESGERHTGLLAQLLVQQRAIDELTVLDRQARVQTRLQRTGAVATEAPNRAESREFTMPLSIGKPYYGQIRFDGIDGEPRLTLAIPMPDSRSGSIEEVLVAEVRLKSIWDLFADLRLAPGQSAYIIDADDRIVAHQDASVVLRGTTFRAPAEDGVFAGLSGAMAVIAIDDVRLGQRSFRVVVEQPLSEALATAMQAVYITLAAIAAMLVVAIGLGYAMVRQIVRPIQRLADAAQAIRAGDLTQQVPAAGHDELGVLAEAFNSMAARLRHLVGGLEGRVEERTARLQAANDRLQREAADRERAEAALREQGEMLAMIAAGARLPEILARLCRWAEAQLPGQMVSVMLLDADGEHLHTAAAPSLPQSYLAAIEGLRVGPEVGSCGAAVTRGVPVIVSDIDTDPLWRDFRGLTSAHGLRACWSSPLLATDGGVLGTFACYARVPQTPDDAAFRLIHQATRIAGIAIDRDRTENRIRHLAHHDALTDLPNRLLLRDRLARALEEAARTQSFVTAAFIDLDNFKWINDSLGHRAGDELLQTVARRLLDNVRASDTVARLGGDEFIVLFRDQQASAEAIVPTLQKIIAAIAEPISAGGREVQVTCSVGLASSADDGGDVDTLLMNADAAMYRAKELGRNNFQFHSSELHARSLERLALQDGLRHAVERNELSLVYQPQIDLASGCMQGVEALLRWHHPERGAISPATFIPIAEEAGLIVPIGDWVLRSACKQAARWAASGLPRLTVAVNVSARQFGEPGWVDSVKRVLDETGLDPSCLELELTESLVMHDVEQAVNVMQRLRALKVRFAIDDFGTGYSSLALLKRLPIEQLKIDRTFVRDIADDDDDKAIVSAVISIGHRLNMTVVAEGVETVEQVEFLRANGCDSIQGYHVGRPMPAGDIEAMLLPSRSAVARNDAADAAATEDATDADAAQEMAHTMAQEMAQEMAAAC